jgi:uncharacterized protein YciI
VSTWVRWIRVTALPDEAAPAIEAHLAHVRELAALGKVRLAGAFPDGDGFLEILEVADRLEAEALTRESPLVALGLAAWSVRPWIEVDLQVP